MPHPGVARANEVRSIQADERARLAVGMYVSGSTQAAIAAEMHISSATVRSYINKWEAETRREIVEDIKGRLLRDLAGLDDLERQANTIRITAGTPALALKAIKTIADIKAQRADLLGLNAPQRLILHPGDRMAQGEHHEHAALDGKTDAELAAMLDGHDAAVRGLRVIETTAEVAAEEDPEPDDGAPPELDFADPGPGAAFPRDPGGDQADPEAEAEEP